MTEPTAPRHQPPWQIPQQPPASTEIEPTVTISPGGLSGGEHAGHIVVSVLTLGLWLPVYGYRAATAPKQRISITAPASQAHLYLPPPLPPRAGYKTWEKVFWAVLAVVVGGALIFAAIAGALSPYEGP